jgi:hypothetical protein
VYLTSHHRYRRAGKESKSSLIGNRLRWHKVRKHSGVANIVFFNNFVKSTCYETRAFLTPEFFSFKAKYLQEKQMRIYSDL